jgi:hypothetical protein
MAKSFLKRLRIPLEGRNINLYSKSGILLATGYNRVVIGKRGPYVEFTDSQICKEQFEIPEEEKYRLTSGICFYDEYRSVDDCYVKLYFQKRKVSYADYKIRMYYISPFDLDIRNNQPTII